MIHDRTATVLSLARTVLFLKGQRSELEAGAKQLKYLKAAEKKAAK